MTHTPIPPCTSQSILFLDCPHHLFCWCLPPWPCVTFISSHLDPCNTLLSSPRPVHAHSLIYSVFAEPFLVGSCCLGMRDMAGPDGASLTLQPRAPSPAAGPRLLLSAPSPSLLFPPQPAVLGLLLTPHPTSRRLRAHRVLPVTRTLVALSCFQCHNHVVCSFFFIFRILN